MVGLYELVRLTILFFAYNEILRVSNCNYHGMAMVAPKVANYHHIDSCSKWKWKWSLMLVAVIILIVIVDDNE